ncbi:MAG TPA: purine-nucleoside phosphorylase [Methanocorpusculum sp.]|nr:purine-nucleoside phosphorylase [Candidatus Methanocorpusculum equi]MCQ2357660.1 purine-nucleoside phosphorylase [Methanocorpusculum sp.]HJJ33511.1 purine-nucleoside phosphorylase [Methanocorpusculum sp.]HJJ44597.1 purine-nucleoside phosphorylase [Methanocorpusculum sp.]HJJ58560.1 purine-nucleoside phosphorylase [Methanocorpusculum sp.]
MDKKNLIILLLAIATAVFLAGMGVCFGIIVSSPADVSQVPDDDAYMERLNGYVSDIRKITNFEPDVAVVLGSGLGGFVEAMDVEATVPYSSLKGFPQSTAVGHAGNFVFGTLNGVKLVAMQGRVHYYEGYDMDDVVLPLRIMHLLGADTVILSCSAGSLNTDIPKGSFVVVKDHISSFVPSPLRGNEIKELGQRFVPMNDVYDSELRKIVLDIGKESGIPIVEGIHLQVPGPQYETPTECNFYRAIGADTVSMSSVVEAIAARQMEMRVCLICCVTDMANVNDSNTQPTNGDDVVATARQMGEVFTSLVTRLIERMPVNGNGSATS